jgi:DNA mismatch repair protein MutS
MFQHFIKTIPDKDIHSHPFLKYFTLLPHFSLNGQKDKENIRNGEDNKKKEIEDMTMEEQIEEFSDIQIDELEQRNQIVRIYENARIFQINKELMGRNRVNCSHSLYQDLEIFENFERVTDSSNLDSTYKSAMLANSATLFDKINKTQTFFGENILKNVLLHPTYDIQILLKRREIIQHLSNNPQLFHQIKEKVTQISGEQKNILWFYQELDEFRKNIYDMIYFQYPYIDFINHRLNKNSTFLLLLQTYKIFLIPIFTILTPILSIVIPLIIWKMTGSKIPFSMICKLLYRVVFQTMWSTDSYKTLLLSFFSIGIWLFFYFQTLYSQIIIAKQTYKIVKIIHEKMHSIYKWITTIEELEEMGRNAGLDFNWIYSINNIHDGDNTGSKSGEYIYQTIKEMKKIVDYGVFKDKHKLLNHKGLILSQYYIFLKNREKMNDLLYYFGQVDLLQSIVSFANEQKYSLSKWTNASKNNRPILKIKNMWHPYFDSAKSIKNSLKMKKETIRLITGPNAAGKSTYIKSGLLNILFAQTICIVPCKDLCITPFHNLFTYLHIPDVKGKQSLFQAEMMRNKEFLEALEKGEKNNQYTFMIMDELFSSTNYEEGVSAAYSILRKMATMGKNKTLTTSHFHELIELEKDTKKKIRNYYFDVNVRYDTTDNNNLNNKKNIEYTYKIKKGYTKKRIAIDLLQHENFDPEIIEGALRIFEKMAK